MTSTLHDELVPAWADELAIVVRDARGGGGPPSGNGEEGSAEPPLPARVWENMSPPTLWLCSDPSGDGPDAHWVALEAGSDVEAPPGRCVAVPIATGEGPAMVVLRRGPDRAVWTALELMMVAEGVRLAEFALSAVDQHRRALDARAAADAAAHRWAAFARLSRRLARSVVLDDVAAAILTATVPYLADWALLDIVAPNRSAVERVGRRHALPAEEALLERLTHFPYGTEANLEAIERLGVGGWLLQEAGMDDLSPLAAGDEHAALAGLAPRSVVVVPLVVGKRPLGALTLATAASGQQYGPGDLALFRSLAHQAALAVSSSGLYRDAERARMEREEVIAVVSHDLKNPLNILRFALAILGQEGMPEEKKAAQFGIMQRSLDQMDELVNNLLDAARMDAGRFSVSPVPLAADALAREALKRAEPLAEKAGVCLEAAGMHDLPLILADRGRLMQVFANLLDNAISFTPPAGYVRLRASAREGAVWFEIEDSGPGLEPGMIEHVFDRFWRARHSGRSGAGLGLAIARGIVEAHGGTIGVRSESGAGAVFHFSIPCATADDLTLPAAGSRERPSPSDP